MPFERDIRPGIRKGQRQAERRGTARQRQRRQAPLSKAGSASVPGLSYSSGQGPPPSASDLASRLRAPQPPASALNRAVTAGVKPSDSFRRLYGDRLADKIDMERIARYVRPREGLKEDPLAEAVIGTVATGGVGGLANLLRGGARAAVGSLGSGASGGGAGAARAIRASEKATEAATGVRGGLKGAAQVARRARQGVTRQASRAGRTTGGAARKTGRAAGRTGRKHPFGSAGAVSGAASIVPELAPGGDLASGLEGRGRFAGALRGAAEVAGVSDDVSTAGIGEIPGLGEVREIAGNAVSDALELPAYVLPSIYLTGAAAVEAAQGDPERAEQMWESFKQESAIPALVSGEWDEAARRAGEHPLYAALELWGIKALAGRGAGALKRRGRAPEKRPPKEVYGNITIPRGRYSKDLINEAVQRLQDRRRARSERGFQATPEEAERYLVGGRGRGPGRVDRTMDAAEGLRRRARSDAGDALAAIEETAGAQNLDAMALAIQRFARNPETAMTDLTNFRNALVARQAELSGGQLRANKATVARIDKALAHDDPEALVAAANEFIQRQKPTQEGLHERGLYDPEQTERASAIGAMRFHEGAGFGKPQATLRQLEQTLNEQRAALPERLSGFRRSVQTAQSRFSTARSGRIQAERSLATLKANARQKAANRKTARGKARVDAEVAQAQRVVEAARQREKAALQELRETTAALDREKAAASTEAKGLRTEIARENQKPPQMLTREGAPLSTQAIREALVRQGADPPGFISNRPTSAGRGAYYQPATTRGTGLSKRTSGEAAMKGISDTSWEAVRNQFIEAVSKLERAKAYDFNTREYGLGTPEGKPWPQGVGRLAVDNPGDYGITLPDIPGGWTTRKTVPWPVRRREREAAEEHGSPAAADEADVPEADLGVEEDFMETVMERAYNPDTPGTEVIYPRLVAQREMEHFARKHPFEKTAEAVRSGWVRVILTSSPGWLTGNVGDIWLIRTPIARVSLGDIRNGRGLERIGESELTPEQLGRAMEELVPGGFTSGSTEHIQMHRVAEMFDGTTWSTPWRAAAMLRRSPGAKETIDLWKGYANWVLRNEAEWIERSAQRGALGKNAREELGLTRRQMRKAIEAKDPVVVDFVRGFRNQDNVDRLARQMESIYGNFTKHGPEARRYLKTWVPFYTWLAAATKFLFVTLPRDHPVLTSIFAASEEMTREERQKFGLDKAEGTEPLPPFLQGGIPDDGGIWKLSNLTSFGMAADLPAAIKDMVAPWIGDSLENLAGVDWKGDRLVDEEGRPLGEKERITAAISTFGLAFIPFFNVGSKIIEEGFENGGFDLKAALEGASPIRRFDPDTVDYLRSISEGQQITVPAGGSGSGGDLSPFLEGYLNDQGGSGSAGGSFLDGYLEDLEAAGP